MAANLRFAAAKIRKLSFDGNGNAISGNGPYNCHSTVSGPPDYGFLLQEQELFRRIPSLLLSLPLQHPALLTVTGEGNSHGDFLDVG